MNEFAPTDAASAVIVNDVVPASGVHPEAPSARLPTVILVNAVPPPRAIEVAVATPKAGVTRVGLVAPTLSPLPVRPSCRHASSQRLEIYRAEKDSSNPRAMVTLPAVSIT